MLSGTLNATLRMLIGLIVLANVKRTGTITATGILQSFNARVTATAATGETLLVIFMGEGGVVLILVDFHVDVHAHLGRGPGHHCVGYFACFSGVQVEICDL